MMKVVPSHFKLVACQPAAASLSSFPDIMAVMIFKSLVGSRDSGGSRDMGSAVVVLVGAGFKPAQS